MWRDLSISKKTAVVVSLALAVYSISLVYGYAVGMRTENSLTYVSSVLFPATQQSQAAVNSFEEQIKLYKDAVMMGEASSLKDAAAKGDEVRTALAGITALLASRRLGSSEVQDAAALEDAFTRGADSVYTQMRTGGTSDAIMAQAAQLTAQTGELRSRLNALSARFARDLKNELDATGADTQKERYLNLVTFFGIILVTVVLVSFLVLGSIRQPIRETVAMLRDIAEGEGDLTKRLEVRGKDEVGELASWFNKFIGQLEEVVGQIKETSVEMDSSTVVVAAESQGLAQSTQEQTSSIEEVTASIHQMASSIERNAENASEGLKITKEIVTMAGNSELVANELMEAMKEVSEASRKIGEIISTVNEVAFQTNLLALNAAVEAARAGDHGKGFSVVADEVRALAHRSAGASTEIRTLIEDTMGKVAAGDRMVVVSSGALKEIKGYIDRLASSMEDIAHSSSEQTCGIDILNRSISQIDIMAQKNSTTVDHLARMSERLSMESKKLASAVGQFRVS